ncbi:MAG: DUF362 domain-containing protein [Calditrichaeota bacterium]|nr:DUF362 domain-containing protein [Calditrichota bacterium]
MERREFLKIVTTGPFLIGLTAKSASPKQNPLKSVTRDGKSRVAVARDPDVWRGKRLNEKRVGELLDKAMVAAFGVARPEEAWEGLFSRGETVGIKVNCLAGRHMSTSQELVWAIVERLKKVGVSARRIIVWDRLNKDLEKAGYKLRFYGPGVRVYGNDHAGYYPRLFVAGEVGSLVSNVAVKECDALIDVPILKDHGIVGVTIALKNYFGAIHNPNKYHNDIGDPYVADANLIPPLRNKTRLIICDAFLAQCDGGPPFMPQWAWKYNGLLVSTDPVALDTVGWKIIEDRRKEVGLPSLKEAGREPTYIATAADAAHRLGQHDWSRIETVEI